MENKNLEKSIHDIFDSQNKYIIPLYQRNFSWRREQIEQLLQDSYSAFQQNPRGHYYIGSLVVLKRSNGDYEVIDGQQRLTVLSLITKILGINKEPRLFYDSRPEVEEFFKEFYYSEDGSCNIGSSQTAHLKNAIEFIKEIDLDAEKHTRRINDSNDIVADGISFKQYFENNVILVCVEIPQDTDVASYFEIMNNRGEQLQKHEILKSLLLSKLEGMSSEEFSKIWTACSQMDTPIQKLFVKEDRCNYFGDDYTKFRFKFTSIENNIDSNSSNTMSLDQILTTTSFTQDNEIDNNTDDDAEGDGAETQYKSIIDFPNFLMHVFKVMCSDKTIPLNEKNMLETYHEVEGQLDSKMFIKTLLFCRTVFDRYIIKTSPDANSEDGERWTLRKPKKESDKWYYVNTFDDEHKQNRIVKALTMLQVSYRTRIYKNWLFDILEWFYTQFLSNQKNLNADDKEYHINVDDKEYLHLLDYIILKNYTDREITKTKINQDSLLSRENSYSEGLKTPHFLFNFIDYLYWVDSKKETPSFESSKLIKPFDFKYWNSIEHHMAREWASRNSEKVPNYENFIDNLGNLCLISKSANSRLSDRDAKEKAETFDKGNLGANRQIMYEITKKNNGNYREEQIKKHYNELLDLLSQRKIILDYHD